MLYTIPSLALFAFLAPLPGSAGHRPHRPGDVCLLVIVRNALTGLQQVPPDVREAAGAWGTAGTAMLWRVELPLALPSIMTGLRIATVSTVALVTVGDIVGFGGFGQPDPGGFRNNFYRAQIMTATLPASLLALLLDLLLVLIGRLLTPWAGARRRGGMSLIERRDALAQRPAELDRPRRHPRPAGEHLLISAVAVRAGLPGRLAGRDLARATPAGGGGLVVLVANLTRAIPTVALLTIFPLTFLGFGRAVVIWRWPSSPSRRCWPTLISACARWTRRSRDAARGMGLSGRQLLAGWSCRCRCPTWQAAFGPRRCRSSPPPRSPRSSTAAASA